MLSTFGNFQRKIFVDDNDWGRITGFDLRNDLPLGEALVIRRSQVQDIAIVRTKRFGDMLWLRVLSEHERQSKPYPQPPQDLERLPGYWQQFSTADEYQFHQLQVLPALYHHRDPQDVLILGGGDLLAAWRVGMRLGIRTITIADWDPMVWQMVREYMPVIRQRRIDDDIRIIFPPRGIDVREFLPHVSPNRYDVVIGDLIDLTSMEDFCPGFAEYIWRILRPGGIFATQMGMVSIIEHDLAPLANAIREFQERFESVAISSWHIESFNYTQGFLYAWKGRRVQMTPPARTELAIRFDSSAMKRDKPFYDAVVHQKAFILEPVVQGRLGLS